MQTHFSGRMFGRGLVCALCAGALLCALSACAPTMPRLEGRAEAEHQLSPCEQALTLAHGLTTDPAQASTPADANVGTRDDRNAPMPPMMVRYLKTHAEPQAWIDVAAQCPSRFGEGTLRSAQSSMSIGILAERLGQSPPDAAAPRLDGVSDATINADVLDAMAVAEDKAGFAVGVLAARGQTEGATLSLSDAHATAGQQLASLAERSGEAPTGSGEGSASDDGTAHTNDSRQKVYAIDRLLANPVTVPDAASGRNVPTAAAIEMDCARAEIKAIDGSKSQSDADTLTALAALAARHAYTAMELGYPTSDDALFL